MGKFNFLWPKIPHLANGYPHTSSKVITEELKGSERLSSGWLLAVIFTERPVFWHLTVKGKEIGMKNDKLLIPLKYLGKFGPKSDRGLK